ncbi:MAG TPA: cytochrome c biogenesis protein CcsA [Opitutaceae bacterium]|nr:cytochrome c biogenesis protein CcsA [Opitutaceae bacterium]
MKRFLPAAILLFAVIWVALSLLPAPERGAFDLAAFGRLPVLADGRMKPLDTIARNALLMLQGRQRLETKEGRTVAPVQWLLDVFYRPAEADAYPVFRIDNPDVLSLFNLTPADGQGRVRFSFIQLQAGVGELDRQARLAAETESALRSPFQRGVIDLQQHLAYYERLGYSCQPPDRPDFAADLADAARFRACRPGFEAMNTFGLLRLIPPAAGGEWSTPGRILAAAAAPADVDTRVFLFAAIGHAWSDGQSESFNALVRNYRLELAAGFPGLVRRCGLEAYFNRADPFATSESLYLLAFLLAAISWLRWPETLGPAAYRLAGLACALATAGIAARMWLEGRPPVTNLYSSALFIGWGSAVLCLVLERLNRNGVAVSAGAFLGFATLVIAHHLSLGGDTMEMMRAVLDSNFWLSTHVVTVTVGYASTFLAGFLAIVYILRGVLTKSLDKATADSLGRMVYGIVCFATFFSFIGTVLGGIWADQSWGRFWGWDPKENGALIIVLWNSTILHCRWGGLIRQRGLMVLAVIGNIATAWSWFGVNMLGIGLHSYGFTQAAFYGLVVFAASQLLLIGLAGLPLARWRSFRPAAA